MSTKLRNRLDQAINAITPLDATLEPAARAHLDDLTKPKGSLGLLEDYAARLTLIAEGGAPGIDPARIYTIAGDHGVAKTGVSLFPQEVTRQMVANFLTGGAGINVLAKTGNIDVKVVDAGSAGGPYDEHPGLIQMKVAEGTENIAEGPAMTEEQCLQALLNGIELADKAAAEGLRALGTGEMGIANTTPSTALYCAYFDISPAEMTGPGTGLPAEGVSAKREIIRKALEVNAEAIDSQDPLRILTALGGYEIATLAGLIIGAAKNRLAVVVDGFISTAAFAAAWKLCPTVSDYAFFSHASAEPGHVKAVQAMQARPMLDLGLRLGEGTGAAIALYLLRCAANIYNDMATFSQAGVDAGSN
ncbi:Nicotinate-nucleotide--dimethylbenzimidazole phosphoribosyltransferase [Desulfovibrio ferrophilus]|uniref:Nicotinate-nucleotide--dimethylbenzimidazole phosphoribosyltransferase n=1 Tax=Desulfovibrio ferrophilus TaxID=241368 RepID=A0A2Z6B2M8_9BACT|nr:nicotinate-nucleotide--dimethylbenzimidazole phosphoribosyltransferase [Desulfovibrio ferrophilus]BBD09784.1 Nicotinate-nucleotide--dimethylbenzimidazole phosphoribosyltransferase [Desulfovibrio ferrophilus]